MAVEDTFFSETEQKVIVNAIQQAEKQTSGEVKVHVERNCSTEDVMERAKEVFGLLNLHETKQRNGVLFYLAYEDRKFAVLGDTGIHEKVTDDFWNSTRDLMRSYFSKDEFVEGFRAGIGEAGIQLKKYFPYNEDDVNELPDDISFG